MQKVFVGFCTVLCIGVLPLCHSANAADLRLGPAPIAPESFDHLPRRSAARWVSGGFTVNTSSREEVRTFYNAVYLASEGVPMNSTAVTASCIPGTNSADFRLAVLRRINWYRAMAGIPSSVILNETFNWKDQQAALMMSRNDTLSHNPPSTWVCYTTEGAEAAGNSNIGIGTSGPDTIAGYIKDHGTNNALVGHRRWLLYPQTQIMGTGDVPGQGDYDPANAVWVFNGHRGDTRPGTRSGFVAWPPAGYAPRHVVFPRWSISYPGANFTNATVSMLSNGVPVAVFKESASSGYGEPTLVWVPMGLDTSSSSTPWPFNGQDTVYSVSIGNVGIGSGTTNWNYTVTVFDPSVPGPDYGPVISGPAEPGVGQPNLYTFTSVPHATSYQWLSMKRVPYSLTDGAESGLGNWMAQTSPGYDVINNNTIYSGAYSFQLHHPTGSSQLLTLNQTFVPQSGTQLSFRSRLLIAKEDEVARVQLSINGGDWFDAFSQPGTDTPESTWQLRTIPLGGYAGAMVQVRFNYDFQGGSYYPVYNQTGWRFDDVSVSNALIPSQQNTNSATLTQFQFVPLSPGDYALYARAFIYTDFPTEWGPAKIVQAVAAPPVIRAGQISVAANQAHIPFVIESGSPGTFKLLQAAQLSGQWTTNNAAVLTTNTPGVSYKFTAPTAGARQFYKIKSP